MIASLRPAMMLWRMFAHPRALTDVLRAGAMMRRALKEVRDAPTGSLVQLNGESVSSASEMPAVSIRLQRQQAYRWARAVRRSQSVPLWRGACLARSIALHHLLVEHHVVGSRICIGVKHVDAVLEAHAWVEVCGTVVSDNTVVTEKFSRLATGNPS